MSGWPAPLELFGEALLPNAHCYQSEQAGYGMARKDPIAATVGANQWAQLPPRDTNGAVLCKLIGVRPQLIEHGCCGMCDTRFSREWCISTERPHYEIWHLTHHDIGVLRPNELPILESWLERQKALRAKSAWHKIRKIFSRA